MIGGQFRCPLCGSSYFRTVGHADTGTGQCKGPVVWLDRNLQPTTEERSSFHEYPRPCSFTWPREEDRLYFVRHEEATP